jgi:glycosyltransferase involved in cell wall biosynthesis
LVRKIAIVLHDFNAGGSEVIAFRLAGEWLKAGCAVTIIAGSSDGPMLSRAPAGVRVEILDPPVPRGLFSQLRLGPAIVPVLEQLDIDLVFIPGNFHFFVARPIRRRFPALSVVAKVSNPLLPPNLPLPRKLAGIMLRWLLAPIDRLVFMSEDLQTADADLVGTSRVAVNAEPNLPDTFVPLPRQGPLVPPLILVIGRMEPQKNLALAIRAFAELKKRRDARLLILGDGRQRTELEALVTRLGLQDAVTMPGFVSDVSQHLSGASLLLMTSRYEGFPAALVEALASDVPVVSTNCSPSQKALISSSQHGEIVDAESPEALAAAMERVLGGPFSSGGVRAAGLEKHRASVSAAAWLALFDSIHRPTVQ